MMQKLLKAPVCPVRSRTPDGESREMFHGPGGKNFITHPKIQQFSDWHVREEGTAVVSSDQKGKYPCHSAEPVLVTSHLVAVSVAALCTTALLSWEPSPQ